MGVAGRKLFFGSRNGRHLWAVTPCGNGELDPAEQCDDGNVASCDGCDADCTVTACGDAIVCGAEACDEGTRNGGVGCCTLTCEFADADRDGLCDDVDLCPELPGALQVGGDGDGVGDECDPCTEPVAVQKGVLKMAGGATLADDDILSVTGTLSIPLTPPIDPLAHGFRLLLHDAEAELVLDAALPGGAYDAVAGSGWRASSTGRAWTYRRAASAPPRLDGIASVSVRSLTPDGSVVRVAVRACRGAYRFVPLPLPPVATIVVDAANATGGQCGTTRFAPAGCVAVRGTVRCR